MVDPPDEQWLIFNELTRMIQKYEKDHPGKTFLRIGLTNEMPEYYYLPPKMKWDASWTTPPDVNAMPSYNSSRVMTTVEKLVIGHLDKYGNPVYTQWVVVFL